MALISASEYFRMFRGAWMRLPALPDRRHGCLGFRCASAYISVSGCCGRVWGNGVCPSKRNLDRVVNETTWAVFVEEMNSLGVEECTRIQQEIYDRYTSK